MTVSVVELLEAIDIHHGDSIGVFQRKQGLVESSATGEPGELVVVRHGIRPLDNSDQQEQCGRRHVGTGDPSNSTRLECEKCAEKGPEKAAFYGLGNFKKTQQEKDAGDCE